MASGQRVLSWGRDDAPAVVLAVHGRGQEPEFMQRLAERFGPLPARFVAPAAPGGSWYPLPFLQPIELNQPYLDNALADVGQRIDQLLESGTAAHELVVFGFSQGACLLTHLLLSSPRAFGAAVLFTGGFIGPDAMTPPTGGSFGGMPVLMRSIQDDPWVPAYRVHESARLFQAAGAEVDLRIDPGNEHIVTDEACDAAAKLIASVRQ